MGITGTESIGTIYLGTHFSAAQSAALSPWKEMPSLVPGSASRPADVFVPTWERGQPAAPDVTVVSTLQNQTVAEAASVSGYVLSVAKERKVAAHSEACQSAGVSFVPMVVETLGGWDEEAVRTITAIGRSQGQRLGIPPSDSTRHLFQRLTVSLWRGMPACGSVALRCILLQLTDRADFSVFVFVFLCLFFVFCFFVFLFHFFNLIFIVFYLFILCKKKSPPKKG